MLSEHFWRLERLVDQSAHAGYLPIGDLPDTGALASRIVMALQEAPPNASIDVWVQADSRSVPRRSAHEPYSQFLALAETRRRLSESANFRASGPFVDTMFGKTLTSFAVSNVDPLTGRALSDPRDANPHVFAPLAHCRLSRSMSLLDAADRIMCTGWIASVASAVVRKGQPSFLSAPRTIGAAVTSGSRLGQQENLDLLKAFTTPPWRSDASDLLTDQRVATRQQDLHFPELLREQQIYRELIGRRGRDDQYLFATDVHGLFLGTAGRWSGIAHLLLPLVRQLQSSEIPLRAFIEAAYQERLIATRRLRETLKAIAAVDGLDCPIFGRGDGIFAFSRTLTTTVGRLAKIASSDSNLLPFGVGIVKLGARMSVRDALARSEAALEITKLATPSSTERLCYLYGEPLSRATGRRLEAALAAIGNRSVAASKTTKEMEGLSSYSGLLSALAHL